MLRAAFPGAYAAGLESDVRWRGLTNVESPTLSPTAGEKGRASKRDVGVSTETRSNRCSPYGKGPNYARRFQIECGVAQPIVAASRRVVDCGVWQAYWGWVEYIASLRAAGV